MEGIPENVWIDWERKRRHTFIAFLFLAFILGLDISGVFATLYTYLKDLVHTDTPTVYYSVIFGCFNLSSLIFCVTIGRWMDKTRKVRLYAHWTLVAQIIGQLLYAIPLHPVFQLVGRIFNGMSDTFASVVSGELFRIYDEQEGIRSNFWLAVFGFTGVLMGPGLSAVFKGTEVKIGRFTLNYLNIPSLAIGGLMIIGLVTVNALVHDCSAEIDLKEYLKQKQEESEVKLKDDDDDDDGNKSEKSDEFHFESTEGVADVAAESEDMCYLANNDTGTIPVKHVIKCFATNPGTVLIFVATFISMYSTYSACVVLPIIIKGSLNWDIRVLSIIVVVYGILGLLLITLLGKFLESSRSIYFTSLFGIICQGLSCFSLALLKLLPRNIYRDIMLMSFELGFLIVGWYFADTLLRVTLAKLVPSKIQSFSECLRAGTTRCAIIIASFVAPNILPWLPWWVGGLFVTLVILLIFYIILRKHFLEPKEFSFDGYILISGSETDVCDERERLEVAEWKGK